MNKKNVIKILSLILTIALITTGCASKSNDGAATNNFRINLSTEPPTLDPAQATDQISYTILNAIYEGLAIVDEQGNIQPGVAEKWDISDDRLTYTFHLRKDATWNNGDAITAQDFEYSWKRVLDPNLEPKPSQYAYSFYYIKGAEAYNTGEGAVEDVAIQATDEHTLVVTLDSPVTFFGSLLSTPIYLPVHSSVKENKAFAAQASTMVTNGPFTLTEWKRNTSITLEPNANYHSKEQIKFNKVTLTMVNDSNSELNMYQTNKLDYAGNPTGLLPTDQYEKLDKEKPDEFHKKGIASLYYYLLNTTKKPLTNIKIRQALAMSVNRKEITEKVTLGGQIPAYGLVPPGIKGIKEEFRTEVPDQFFSEDIEAAKKLLAEGLAEEGLTEMPEVTLSYNTHDLHQKVAEAVVDMWRKNLGIQVKIGNEEWGVYLGNRSAMNHEISRGGWGADYNDPISFVGLFTSKSGNNNTGYANPAFDALVEKVNSTDDQEVRMKTMAEAEKMLIEAYPIIPLFYYSNVYMLKPNVKGVYVDFKGDVQFARGYFEE